MKSDPHNVRHFLILLYTKDHEMNRTGNVGRARLRNVLIFLGWSMVCVALATALAFKLGDFGLFVQYVSTVTGWSSGFSILIASAVVAAEGAVVSLGLRQGSLSRAAALGAGLFFVFVVFHTVRITVGDPLPCACFGTALHWPPLVFAVIDATLLGICLAVYLATRSVTVVSTLTWQLRSLWTLACLALTALEVRVLIPSSSSHHTDGGRFDRLRASQMLSTTGFVHRGGTRRTIFVFGDYECPFSRDLMASPEWQALQRDQETTLVWKELPLTLLHPVAMRLALLSKAAALEGHLYEFGTAILRGGFDGKSADALIARLPAQTREIAELEVQDDLRLAEDLRIDRTPTIVLIDAKGAREIDSLKEYAHR